MKRLPLTLGALITLAGCDAAPEAGSPQVDVPGEPLSVETEPLLSVGGSYGLVCLWSSSRRLQPSARRSYAASRVP